jgi:hypothetical protein
MRIQAITVILLITISITYMGVSKLGCWGQTLNVTRPIRNLGGLPTLGNVSGVNMTGELDLDLVNLVSSLLEAAALLEKYNESLAEELRGVAGLVLSGNLNDAFARYEELKPYIEEALKSLSEVDPEVFRKLLSLLPGDIRAAAEGESTPPIMEVPEPPEMPGLSPIIKQPAANLPAPTPAVEVPYLEYVGVAMAIIAAIYAFAYFREPISRLLAPKLSRVVGKIALKLKMGAKPRDPRQRIIYNYRYFLLVMDRAGSGKRWDETPREFLRRIDRRIFEPSRELTALFEKARYSPYTPTTEDARRSDEVVKDIESRLFG